MQISPPARLVTPARPNKPREGSRMRLTVESFGYSKSGPPDIADAVFDVRHVGDPKPIKDMRYRNGLDSVVHENVFSDGSAEDVVKKALAFVKKNASKKELTIAFGCSAGRHRSVAIAEEVARRVHREVGRDVMRATYHKEILVQLAASNAIDHVRDMLAEAREERDLARGLIYRMKAEIERLQGLVGEEDYALIEDLLADPRIQKLEVK